MAATLAPPRVLAVLVIDDNKDAADSLALLLRLHGHRAATAYTGPGGLAYAEVIRFDAILCDIGLPGVDGLEVARRLRADPRTAGSLLVAVSGYATAEDRRRSLDAGFVAHLAKPLDWAELAALLARIT